MNRAAVLVRTKPVTERDKLCVGQNRPTQQRRDREAAVMLPGCYAMSPNLTYTHIAQRLTHRYVQTQQNNLKVQAEGSISVDTCTTSHL